MARWPGSVSTAGDHQLRSFAVPAKGRTRSRRNSEGLADTTPSVCVARNGAGRSACRPAAKNRGDPTVDRTIARSSAHMGPTGLWRSTQH